MTGYYDGPDLERRVLEALRTAGRPLDQIDPDDLAGLDKFHALGRAGTLALAKLADVRPWQLVLDVGAGIGGPSRVLARHYQATVTALEPTKRFATLARTLTDRSSLIDHDTVIEGNGRALPFADASYDLAWTQAVWQSAEDKASLTREIKRVLRPGGRLALLEVIGDGRELRYPVPGPTARRTASSFPATSWPHCLGLGPQTSRTSRGAPGQTPRRRSWLRPPTPNGWPRVSPASASTCSCPATRHAMASLASNVEAGRISLLPAVMTKEDTPTIPPSHQRADGQRSC
jgi:SAM-dependent methyltransferase